MDRCRPDVAQALPAYRDGAELALAAAGGKLDRLLRLDRVSEPRQAGPVNRSADLVPPKQPRRSLRLAAAHSGRRQSTIAQKEPAATAAPLCRSRRWVAAEAEDRQARAAAQGCPPSEEPDRAARRPSEPDSCRERLLRLRDAGRPVAVAHWATRRCAGSSDSRIRKMRHWRRFRAQGLPSATPSRFDAGLRRVEVSQSLRRAQRRRWDALKYPSLRRSSSQLGVTKGPAARRSLSYLAW